MLLEKDGGMGGVVTDGSRSCIVDYFPKRKYPKSSMAAKWSLNAATVLVLYGLYEFETNDVGITEGVKKIWKA